MNSRHKIAFCSAVFAMIFLLGMIVFGDNGYMDLCQRGTELSELSSQNQVLENENSALYRQIKRLKHDPRYVENVARRELGMIGKNEVIFKFKEDSNGAE